MLPLTYISLAAEHLVLNHDMTSHAGHSPCPQVPFESLTPKPSRPSWS